MVAFGYAMPVKTTASMRLGLEPATRLDMKEPKEWPTRTSLLARIDDV
jgi:hypothetical protein